MVMAAVLVVVTMRTMVRRGLGRHVTLGVVVSRRRAALVVFHRAGHAQMRGVVRMDPGAGMRLRIGLDAETAAPAGGHRLARAHPALATHFVLGHRFSFRKFPARGIGRSKIAPHTLRDSNLFGKCRVVSDSLHQAMLLF